ncbi:MAG: DUF2442 domain-containing protein [Candidatus Hydrogenedentes bacterium]|nr:DUF2442 domain-containing protein [Candidatus Hydrogenedentota bacterium]
MSILKIETAVQASEVFVSDHELTVRLVDGRTISAPLAWFPRLLHATPLQRATWEFLGDGEGIHWPEIDEDISVEGLLAGIPARGAKSK